MSIHCNANIGDIERTVLMPGDPLRAKYIAENFLEDAKLVNTVRNMLAYTGTYKGKKVTVFSSVTTSPRSTWFSTFTGPLWTNLFCPLFLEWLSSPPAIIFYLTFLKFH